MRRPATEGVGPICFIFDYCCSPTLRIHSVPTGCTKSIPKEGSLKSLGSKQWNRDKWVPGIECVLAHIYCDPQWPSARACNGLAEKLQCWGSPNKSFNADNLMGEVRVDLVSTQNAALQAGENFASCQQNGGMNMVRCKQAEMETLLLENSGIARRFGSGDCSLVFFAWARRLVNMLKCLNFVVQIAHCAQILPSPLQLCFPLNQTFCDFHVGSFCMPI